MRRIIRSIREFDNEVYGVIKNVLTNLLKINHPIIQAPMAGGVTTSTLVGAVSNCGGLGMIGAGYLNVVQTREQIREIRKLTGNTFGINLFVPEKFKVAKKDVELANQKLEPIRQQLQIPKEVDVELPVYQDALEAFHEQIKVVIEERVPVCSFTFGLPSQEIIRELKQHDIILIGTATTVREAIEVEKSGMDLVVVQGCEAGGHRGNFINDFQESVVGLMSLIPQIVDHVNIPVIAAGGIMDGRGLRASLCLGAQGVQMGTAFLTCYESGAHPVHKEAILKSNEDQSVLTRSFSGKWARGIKNQYITDMQVHETSFPDFPIQNAITQDIRRASSVQNNQDFMSLWSGQSPRLAKNQSVENLIQSVMDQAGKIKYT